MTVKLFGKDREQSPEAALPAEEQPKETAPEEAAPADEAAGSFVMDIEGLNLEAEEAPVQSLRGATNALPGQEQIQKAVAAAAEAIADPASEEAPLPAAEEQREAAPETAAKEAPAAAEAPAAEPESLSSVSYESVAQAVVNAKKEPTGRFERDAVDDETLLAELYALIGDKNTKKPAAPAAQEPAAPVQPRPIYRPAARITPETLQDAPEEFIEVEEDTAGIPGWLKGAFILLMSLLLSAMTFYAVASDVIGQIF